MAQPLHVLLNAWPLLVRASTPRPTRRAPSRQTVSWLRPGCTSAQASKNSTQAILTAASQEADLTNASRKEAFERSIFRLELWSVATPHYIMTQPQWPQELDMGRDSHYCEI
ncbi:hypothetical protein C2E23DRAFT_818936 [Lenzites betulinus]|nr:hypothetical protein C2E23DRAFT_818936 [Lenzites betulinus]